MMRERSFSFSHVVARCVTPAAVVNALTAELGVMALNLSPGIAIVAALAQYIGEVGSIISKTVGTYDETAL